MLTNFDEISMQAPDKKAQVFSNSVSISPIYSIFKTFKNSDSAV